MSNTNKTPKKAAIYLRVSTDKQTTENQRIELERVAQFSGWDVVEVYEDHGISGKVRQIGQPLRSYVMMLQAGSSIL